MLTDDNQLTFFPNISKVTSNMDSHSGLSEYSQRKIQAIFDLVNHIDHIPSEDGRLCSPLVEQHVSNFKTHVDFFQEQPHLLDSKLQPLTVILVNLVIKYKDSNKDKRDLSFAILYLLTKVRGFKKVVHFLPHEVQHLHIVMSIIEREDADDSSNWESKYMLLLWLSVLVMIPLNMERFDASGDSNDPSSFMQRIYGLILRYMLVTGKHRDAAPFLAAKFLTRPEILPRFLRKFIDWSLKILSTTGIADEKHFSETGVMTALYYLFKLGRRVDVSPFGVEILSKLLSLNLIDCKDDIIVKYTSKLSQRIVLSFLKEQDVSWRYQKHRKVIGANGQTQVKVVECLDTDIEVPEQLEDVIDLLLTGLKKEQTVVRWSCAKGIGRISAKLPRELVKTVMLAVLDLCSLDESEYVWHGACLSLAELGRRGLILPESLPQVFSRVKEAAVYDEFKGCFSVGSHVRDAACYVCWSFARAYSPSDLKPFIDDLGSTLLITSVFDREVNCRRAAAAAFQEIVGRQGDLPNGIEIISVIDYHSVGHKKNSYVELAPFLVKFETYQESLVRHLLPRKVGHWDKEIRSLAAESLYHICLIIPSKLVQDYVIPELMVMSTQRDLYGRHGSILGLGSVIRALKELNHNVSSEILSHVRSLSVDETFKKFQTGVGCELHVEAMTCMIRDASIAKLPIHGDSDLISSWFSLIIEACFGGKQNKNTVQSGIQCTPFFVQEYLSKNEAIRMEHWFDNVVRHFTSSDETIRTTAFQVFTAFPAGVLTHELERTLLNFLVNYISGQKDMKMSNARATAVSALGRLIKNMSTDKLLGLPDAFITNSVIRKCLIACSRDYTTGSRGDIAFRVRWNALSALEEVILSLLNRNDSQCRQMIESDHNLVTEILDCLVVHCVTNQEQIRPHASSIFWHLVQS